METNKTDKKTCNNIRAYVERWNKGIIKAHGSSNAKAIKNAIRQAREFTKMDLVEKIKKDLQDNPCK